jgi:hypothetical protein
MSTDQYWPVPSVPFPAAELVYTRIEYTLTNPAAVGGTWLAMKFVRLTSVAPNVTIGFGPVFGADAFGKGVASDSCPCGKDAVGVEGSGCAKYITARFPGGTDGSVVDAWAKSNRWLRLLPPVTTEQVLGVLGLVQLQRVRLPSELGSGSHGGVVAALAAPAVAARTPPVIISIETLATTRRRFIFIVTCAFLSLRWRDDSLLSEIDLLSAMEGLTGCPLR